MSKALTEKDLTPKKIVSLLAKSGVTREKICNRLNELLDCKIPIVADGEIISYEPDNKTRLRAVEVLLDVIGEKKLVVPEGEFHVHFTSILQQIRAYERGDERAVKQAGVAAGVSAVDAVDVTDIGSGEVVVDSSEPFE